MQIFVGVNLDVILIINCNTFKQSTNFAVSLVSNKPGITRIISMLSVILVILNEKFCAHNKIHPPV